jgi:hypothetical protein
MLTNMSMVHGDIFYQLATFLGFETILPCSTLEREIIALWIGIKN